MKIMNIAKDYQSRQENRHSSSKDSERGNEINKGCLEKRRLHFYAQNIKCKHSVRKAAREEKRGRRRGGYLDDVMKRWEQKSIKNSQDEGAWLG